MEVCFSYLYKNPLMTFGHTLTFEYPLRSDHIRYESNHDLTKHKQNRFYSEICTVKQISKTEILLNIKGTPTSLCSCKADQILCFCCPYVAKLLMFWLSVKIPNITNTKQLVLPQRLEA